MAGYDTLCLFPDRLGSLGKSFLKRTMYVVRLFLVMMNVTAMIINMIPQINRGVRLSPKMVTPKNTAVTGSSAPRMATGVAPMYWIA